MRPMMILTALAVAAAAHSLPMASVHAQTPERDGRCRGPDGKEATDPACKGAGPAPAASSVYRLDSKGRCRDDKGKMAKVEMCGAAETRPAKDAPAGEKQKP